ncbi:putative ribonuclease H-like domain-containing protein [Tanacetum coccineum]|uniref:Ribonuclease H-like domain-containing protein n=1 Tax=Tanacetum coccineum TaxID=301880 RepID=A0ABQ5AB54_9ASTR
MLLRGINTVKGTRVNTARPKAVLSAVKGNKGNAVKASTCWGNLHQDLKDKGVIDSGCSRHMTRNRSYLTDYEEFDGVSHKCKIRTGKLDFEDVYFVKELKFNLFSVSQMCDKKNNVLFTDTECVVLSPDFKLADERGLTYLFAKAMPDESNLWHRRLGHVNFKTINKLVKGNLVRDHLGKFDGKADEGFFVGYSTNSKAFRVFNSRTRIIEENLHVKFSEDTPNITGSTKACDDACKTRMETVPGKDHILLPLWTQDPPFSSSLKDFLDAGLKPSGEEKNKDTKEPGKEGGNPSKEGERINQEKDASVNSINTINTVSPTVNTVGIKDNVVDENIVYGCVDDPNMPELEEIGIFSDAEDDNSGADMNNLDTYFQNKARLVVQEYTQEERIDNDEVFDPVARIEAIRLFLAYDSFKDFVVYQMYVKSAFIYVKIEKEVYVCQPPGLKTQTSLTEYTKYKRHFMDCIKLLELGLQVKQKEDGIFISQNKYMNEILNKFGFSDVKTASTPMETHKILLKDIDGEDVDEHLYRSMIGSLMYLTSSRPNIMFTVCACARFQVNHKISHLHAVKRIFRYLKGQPKLGLWYPKDSPFDLVAYTGSDYARASLDRKSTTGGCQFLGCRLILWQCKKQTVVPNSINKAEYIAASNCYGQASLTTAGLLLLRKVNAVRHNLLLSVQVNAVEVDKKKIVITESTIRRDLHLEDAEGTECLPTATIFDELTRISGPIDPIADEAPNKEHVPTHSNDLLLSDKGLGDLEDASKQGRKIDEIDQDAEVTLVDETHGRYSDNLMFDTSLLDNEEVFVGQDMAEKEVDMAEKDVSIANPVSTAGEVVTTASVEIPYELTLAQSLIEIKSAKPKAVTTAATTVTPVSTRPRGKGIVFHDQEEQAPISTPIVSSSQLSQIKDKGLKIHSSGINTILLPKT